MSFSEFYFFSVSTHFWSAMRQIAEQFRCPINKSSSNYVVGTLSYVVKHLFLRPLLLTFFEKIQVFRYQSSIDTFLTQNINQNVLSRSIRNVKILFFLSVANTMIFKHCFFNSYDIIVINRCVWTTCMRYVFGDFTSFNQCFVIKQTPQNTSATYSTISQS